MTNEDYRIVRKKRRLHLLPPGSTVYGMSLCGETSKTGFDDSEGHQSIVWVNCPKCLRLFEQRLKSTPVLG